MQTLTPIRKTLKELDLTLGETELLTLKTVLTQFTAIPHVNNATIPGIDVYTITDALRKGVRAYRGDDMWTAIQLLNKINRQHSRQLCDGFSMIEMLMVIVIIGLICAITIPAIHNMQSGIVQGTVSPVQLREDILAARADSIETRCETYLIIDTNTFTTITNVDRFYIPTNLVPFSSYCVVSFGDVADQPGNHHWKQLTTWEQLPSQEWFFSSSLSNVPSVSIGSLSFPCVGGFTLGTLSTTNILLPLVFGPSFDRLDPASTNTAAITMDVDGKTGFVTTEQHYVK